jgi:hypothetical protein
MSKDRAEICLFVFAFEAPCFDDGVDCQTDAEQAQRNVHERGGWIHFNMVEEPDVPQERQHLIDQHTNGSRR